MASDSRIESVSSALSLGGPEESTTMLNVKTHKGAAESTTMLNVKTRKSFMVVEEHIETKQMAAEDHESHR